MQDGRSIHLSLAEQFLSKNHWLTHLSNRTSTKHQRYGSSSRPTWRPQPAPACMSANSSRRRGCRLDRPRRPAIPPSRRRSPPATGPARPTAKPSTPTLPRSTRPAPAAETRSAEHVLAELEALRTELYVLQIAGGLDSARQIAVTAEQLTALPEPVAKEVAGLAALPFAIIPVGAPEGREKRLALRTLAEITNAAEMSCGAVRLATPTDGRRRGEPGHRRPRPADPGRAPQTDPAGLGKHPVAAWTVGAAAHTAGIGPAVDNFTNGQGRTFRAARTRGHPTLTPS